MTAWRPALSAHLARRLEAFGDGFRHNMAWLGPLGSGKTHLLQRAMLDADARLLKIECSLRHSSMPEFMRLFATSVLRTVAEGDLPTLLERAAPVAPKTTEAVRQLLRSGAGHVSTEAFIHTLDLIPTLHRELQRPCVLVLDEFLRLGELGVSHAFHELGKRVVTWPYTLFLVSSSSPEQAREILRERLQLLFGQFELVTLGPLDPVAGLAWLQQELPGSDDELLRFLLDWVGPSAWHLQVLAQRVREVAQLRAMARIDEEALVQAAWDVMGRDDGVLYQWCAGKIERLSRERHGVLAREALQAIAHGAKTTQAVGQVCGARRSLPQALALLGAHELAHRKGACWVIPDQVLGFWVAMVSDRAPQGREVAAPFRHALSGLWTDWRHRAQGSLAQRISELFGQFHNETVSLDHKTGRLPSFRTMRATPSPHDGQTYLLADSDEQRWCCLVHEGRLEESAIAAFDRFCQTQSPRPSRKVVVSNRGMELNAKLLAKEANMWVWEPEDVQLLSLLYGSRHAAGV